MELFLTMEANVDCTAPCALKLIGDKLMALRILYLSELWLWVCWVFSLQARGFIDQITEESVVSLDASYGLLHLLEEGKGHSATWTVNA
jgi:hypothetical protein